MHDGDPLRILNRRAFLAQGGLVLLASHATVSSVAWGEESSKPASRCKLALMTDLHYADREPTGSRYYRETLQKLEEAVWFYEKARPEFVVELGDFIDAADTADAELGYLKTINGLFSKISPNRHYVLGNHCVYTLTKQEFLDEVGKQRSYYSFDHNGVHFVVLDCCFRSDGVPYGRKNFVWTDSFLPDEELAWLKEDLTGADTPTMVFTHQRLDVSNNYGIHNCETVRKVLQESGRVLAVFQGHSHKNDYKLIDGIHYCTMAAMIEGSGLANSSYALVEVLADGAVVVAGQRRQQDYRWS